MTTITAYDLKENLLALLLSVHQQIPPEQAFLKITGEGIVRPGRPRVEIDQEWLERLRAEGKGYREISRITGHGYSTVWMRLNRDKAREGKA